MGSATGAMKIAAGRLGLSVEDYAAQRSAKQKHCFRCRTWKPVDQFYMDASRGDGRAARCIVCHNRSNRDSYAPIPVHLRLPLGPARGERRCGDKQQARSRINHDVKLGLRPNPNDLHCAHCGHKGDDQRHEYHHHMGYGAAHHYDVLPLCAACHHKEHRHG